MKPETRRLDVNTAYLVSSPVKNRIPSGLVNRTHRAMTSRTYRKWKPAAMRGVHIQTTTPASSPHASRASSAPVPATVLPYLPPTSVIARTVKPQCDRPDWFTFTSTCFPPLVSWHYPVSSTTAGFLCTAYCARELLAKNTRLHGTSRGSSHSVSISITVRVRASVGSRQIAVRALVAPSGK